MTLHPRVLERQQTLIAEANVLLDAIRSLAAPGVADPLTDPATLTRAVTTGILDAPQLRNNRFGRGQHAHQDCRRRVCRRRSGWPTNFPRRSAWPRSLVTRAAISPLPKGSSKGDNNHEHRQKLCRDRRGPRRPRHGRPSGIDGVPGDTLQSHTGANLGHQGAWRYRPGKQRWRDPWLWPAGIGDVRHGSSAVGRRPGHGGRSIVGARRHRTHGGAAFAGWSNRRAAPGPYVGRNRVCQDSLRRGLQGGRDYRRSRDLYLCQPFRRAGPGAHLSYQGIGAAGRAAGQSARPRSWRRWRRPIRSLSTASACCTRA